MHNFAGFGPFFGQITPIKGITRDKIIKFSEKERLSDYKDAAKITDKMIRIIVFYCV